MKNKKRISKLLLISSTALSVPMICTVVAKSSPRIRIPKMITSGISRIGNIFRPSTSSTQTPRVVLTSNLRTNAGSSGTSSLNQNTSSNVATSSNTPSTSQGINPQYNFDKYKQTNYYKQQSGPKRVLKPTSKPENSILEHRDATNGGEFQVKKGINGTEHRTQVTPNGTYTETYDSSGQLILKSERSADNLITEWINNNKVVKREVRTQTGIVTTRFDDNGFPININKLSR